MAVQQDEDDGIISAINVTPLVDITLVLLIIMMVTAKIIVSTSLPLDLPEANEGDNVKLVFAVELRANGDLVVDGQRLDEDGKVKALAKDALAKDKELR